MTRFRSPAKFLVRMDDACPTMRASAWSALESAFDRLAIRPIVGVIPDNQDRSLHVDPPAHDFWGLVRRWQDKGWTIALHGLHHTYHRIPASARALVPMHRESEYVGLPLARQRAMFRAGMAIFRAERVAPTMFMAPSHTFDEATLQALLMETDITTVTDGLALAPHRRSGLRWIPQQLWRFRRLPFGVWTVCLHPNVMTPEDVRRFIDDLDDFASDCIDARELDSAEAPDWTWIDQGFERLYLGAMCLKRSLR